VKLRILKNFKTATRDLLKPGGIPYYILYVGNYYLEIYDSAEILGDTEELE
jgi:hypothetical protein